MAFIIFLRFHSLSHSREIYRWDATFTETYEGLTNEEINAYVQMMQTELPKLDGRTISIHWHA